MLLRYGGHSEVELTGKAGWSGQLQPAQLALRQCPTARSGIIDSVIEAKSARNALNADFFDHFGSVRVANRCSDGKVNCV